jgi:hypothetical protein
MIKKLPLGHVLAVVFGRTGNILTPNQRTKPSLPTLGVYPFKDLERYLLRFLCWALPYR